MTQKALSVLIHGHSKVGKTTLAATAPAPRLILDVESASRFLDINSIVWEPAEGPPPRYDGTWDTVVVPVRDYTTATVVYDYLKLGNHDFKSLIVDSVSELQVRLQEQVSGRGQIQMQQWGDMLRQFSFLMRDMRDLTMHRTQPFEAVVLTAMTRQIDGIYKPHVQGQLSAQIPYWFDIVGYYYVDQDVSEDPTIAPVEVRRLLTRKHPQFEAGERVQGRIAPVVTNPRIDQMIEDVFPTSAAAQA